MSEGTAWSPTAGATGLSLTTTLPTAWILRPPIGSASSQYLPGFGMSSLVTKIAPTSASSPPSTPIRSERAVVSRNGFPLRSRASQTLAFGRVIDATLAVDDEKRQPNVAWAEVRGPGDDRNVFTGSVQQSFKSGVRLLLR